MVDHVPANRNDTVLRCAGIERSFGGLKALKGVSLDVHRGEIFGLVGPNGSGKTTMVNVVTGFYPPNAGSVTLFGEDITRLAPHAVARRGVARTFQNLALFRGMSVLDNIMLGRHVHMRPSVADRANAKAGYLSGGEQQMLAIARALMTQPRLLLLDEPSLGLAPFLVDEIFDIVRKINAETKVAVLLVEQNAAAALEIAHSAYLVENGRIVMNGTAEVLRANPDINAAYLGGGYRTDYHAVKHYRRRRRWLA
jgi:branched-chain amino acid transport system ATP-binding protein